MTRAYLWLVAPALLLPIAPPVLFAEPLTVSVVSPRPGLLFTDSETPQVSVAVGNAPAEVRVEYSLHETDGPWETTGTVSVPVTDGRGEAPLPLALPGRGLYPLTVKATCGEITAEASTSVAVVFTPPAPDPASPWGIFFSPPAWVKTETESDPAAAAQSHRLLGAAWSRLNFWAGSFGKITIAKRDGKPYVTGDYANGKWKQYAKALRAEGISIMGEIAQCPSALSSKEGDRLSDHGDAGEMQNRVKPRDYAEWDSLMENLARDFSEEIQYWEIWNEVNLVGGYWAGTQEELLELVQHTSAALKRGNPNAKVLGCGFVGGLDYADRMLELGMGKYIDILSVHYTDESPGIVEKWRELLDKHGLKIPIWNSEERSEAPLYNLSSEIQRSFKFMHIHTGYEAFRLLVNADYTARPPAIWYSVGAHCIGTAKAAGVSDAIPGCKTYLFQRGEEQILAISGHPLKSLLATGAPTVAIAAEPLSAASPITLTDRFGRSRPLHLTDGEASFVVDQSPLYVNGARIVRVVQVQQAPEAEGLVAEAEEGSCSGGWGRNPKSGFSGDKVLELWSDKDPGPEGYWAEVKLNVPRAGRYEVLFAGNSLTRLEPPRSLSPFVWSIDGQQHVADKALPVATDIAGAPEGISLLGEVELTAGEHVFRLRLTAPRDTPDRHYALWFDAIALRPAAPGR